MIRNATPSDYSAIRAIIRHAFGRADEANLVERLREDGDALIELVAGDDLALVGHILYSPVDIAREAETLKAAALAPVSVLPAFQGKGTGGALIKTGNERCAALGLDAILVLGHAGYYPRFGFSAQAAELLNAPFSGPSFMALPLRQDVLVGGGRVQYARAFGV